MSFSLMHCVHGYTYLSRQPIKNECPSKNQDMNMAKIACFLSLLMALRLHNTCNQGNKYMECAEQYCALIYEINSMKE